MLHIGPLIHKIWLYLSSHQKAAFPVHFQPYGCGDRLRTPWQLSVQTCPAPDMEPGLTIWSPRSVSHCRCKSHFSTMWQSVKRMSWCHTAGVVMLIRWWGLPPPKVNCGTVLCSSPCSSRGIPFSLQMFFFTATADKKPMVGWILEEIKSDTTFLRSQRLFSAHLNIADLIVHMNETVRSLRVLFASPVHLRACVACRNVLKNRPTLCAAWMRLKVRDIAVKWSVKFTGFDCHKRSSRWF